MSESALDLELVVSEDRAVTIPPSELARLSVAVPGQRVRVRIEKAPALAGRCLARSRNRAGPR